VSDLTPLDLSALAGDPWMLGRNITHLRRAAGLSQTQLAALLPSGSSTGHVTRQTVSRWEIGQCLPERHHLRALAKRFGVTEAQLFSPPPAEPAEPLPAGPPATEPEA